MSFKPVEIPEVDYANTRPPETILGFGKDKHTIEHEDGITYFTGRGNRKDPEVMFVAPCPLEEELDSKFSPAMLLKGAPGGLFQRSCERAGIKLEDNYYTTLCKYCLPRKKKLKPSPEDVKRCRLMFEKELKQRKPRVVVCLGKTVFDYFYDLTFQEREILGGWFDPPAATIQMPTGEWSEPDKEDQDAYELTKPYECYRDFQMFVMGPMHVALNKPEALEAQTFDLREVRNHLEQVDRPEIAVPTNYQLLDTVEKVSVWANEMLATNKKLFSVDCEWGGEDHMTGRLRSVQVCWDIGQAAMLQLFDETGEPTFNFVDMEVVKQLFQKVMNRPDVRFIGHNFAADYLWLKHHMGVDPYKRCVFDTMYAMHTVDETYDLKLERLSIRFTDLGRYDIPLAIWKKKNKELMKKDGGYGAVPTDILLPYSCADVDVPFRAYPKLTRLLLADGTLPYYVNLKLPYVTDGYAHMSENGIPLNADDARDVRESFTMVSMLMRETFKQRVRESADTWLLSMLVSQFGEGRAERAVAWYSWFLDGKKSVSDNEFKQELGAKAYAEQYDKLMHWQDARDFNPNSSHQKMRWLFDFKGFRPVKSTKNDSGPSVSWDKVEELPAGLQKNYTPSTDKEVLQIYAQNDDDCQLLVEQLAVNQVIKSFLKAEDKGLEAHIREDGRVHTSFLSTETNRPRSIRPNILNIPAYLSERIETGFERSKQTLCDRFGSDDIDEAYEMFYNSLTPEERVDMPLVFRDPVPLRWCFRAPEDWCFVDADYATAEVFALGYLANDRELIAALTEDDPQFVLIKESEDAKEKAVRVAYVDGVTQFTEDAWDQSLLHDLDELEQRGVVVHDDDGNPKHPKRDVHWEMAENAMLLNQPREKLQKKLHRDGLGKVGNFSTPYGASPSLLERMVEVNTGVKPNEGDGQKIIDAYNATKPRAAEFLDELRELPADPGYYMSPTGAKRHFKTHQDNDMVGDWTKMGILKGQQRESANCAFQGIVADTLARAVVMLIDRFRQEELQASIACPLYDALYIICPIHEKQRVQELMKECMSLQNGWDLPGGHLTFNLDFEVSKRWSVSPTEEEQEELDRKVA